MIDPEAVTKKSELKLPGSFFDYKKMIMNIVDLTYLFIKVKL